MSYKKAINDLDYPALLMAGIDPPKDFWSHYHESMKIQMAMGDLIQDLEWDALNVEGKIELKRLQEIYLELCQVYDLLWHNRYGKMLEKRRKELENFTI